jgi:hypothetical protein
MTRFSTRFRALTLAFVAGAAAATMLLTAPPLGAASFVRMLLYAETKKAPTISANAFTVDLSTGTQFQVTLNANVTGITFSNVPWPTGYAGSWTIALTQDGTGGRTVTGWPAAVKWVGGGVAPTITATASRTDLVSCITYDAGTTDWCVFNQNFN